MLKDNFLLIGFAILMFIMSIDHTITLRYVLILYLIASLTFIYWSNFYIEIINFHKDLSKIFWSLIIFETLIEIASDLFQIKIKLFKSKIWLKTMKINKWLSCVRGVHKFENFYHGIFHNVMAPIIYIFDGLALLIQGLDMVLFLVPVFCGQQ